MVTVCSVPSPDLSFQPDEHLEVYVSAYENPNHFWIQILGVRSLQLDKLTEEMTRFYSGGNSVRTPAVITALLLVFFFPSAISETMLACFSNWVLENLRDAAISMLITCNYIWVTSELDGLCPVCPQEQRVETLVVGDIVAAPYRDHNKWNRARVLGVQPSGLVDLYYVDFGDNEELAKESLCRIRSVNCVKWPKVAEKQLWSNVVNSYQ